MLYYSIVYPDFVCLYVIIKGVIIMTKNLIESLQLKQLFKPGETIVLALSGGVDSMVLFNMLKTLDLKIIIAHINHKKRAESDFEYKALKKLGNGLNIIFEGTEINADIAGNFQQEARNIRYRFFKQIASKYETRKIVLAHHLDDQIETFFMRISKGANIKSYKGMPLIALDGDFELIRPLINTPKNVIEEYASMHKIVFYADQSNDTDDYTRNRFRNYIMPFFLDENPNFYATMQDNLDYFNTISLMLDDVVNGFLKRFPVKVPINAFSQYDKLHQHNILLELIKRHNISKTITKHNLNEIIAQLTTSNKNLVLRLSDDYSIHKEYDVFFIKKFKSNSKFYRKVERVGTYNFETRGSFIVSHNKLEHHTTNFSELWYNNTVFPLIFRNRKPGDKIKLKMGHKKIKDLLIDLKVPPHKRDDLVLVCSEDKVLAIPSLGISCFNENKNNKLYIYEVQNVK